MSNHSFNKQFQNVLDYHYSFKQHFQLLRNCTKLMLSKLHQIFDFDSNTHFIFFPQDYPSVLCYLTDLVYICRFFSNFLRISFEVTFLVQIAHFRDKIKAVIKIYFMSNVKIVFLHLFFLHVI